jgi:triosephosphate isomerase
MKKISPLIIGNWKMNPTLASENMALARTVAKTAKKYPTVSVFVAPAFPFLSHVAKAAPTLPLIAQTVHHQPLGAFTGEVSPTMLQGLGVSGVIIGHSERRALGETNEQIEKKLTAALKHKLTPIVCVGEQTRDSLGDFFTFVEEQVKSLFIQVQPSRYKDIILAYEPIWAIGTGKTATPDDVVEMQLFIHKVLTNTIGRTGAKKVRIIYGGSVTEQNAEALFTTGHIDGFLVGGASLRPAEFTQIIKIVAANI